MDQQLSAELRAIVAQVVREVAADLPRAVDKPVKAAAVRDTERMRPTPTLGPQPTGPLAGASRSRTESIRMTGNPDLERFAFRLLELFDNPKSREDVRTGRLKFVLAGGVVVAAAPGAVERIDKGAVTERAVAAAAANGARLVLGRRAVLTPLAREKARALGVLVEKENQ